MRLENTTEKILQRALDGLAPTKEECVQLLDLLETSLEARALMAVADTTSRRRFGNQGMLLGQIGVATAPCPGKCGFCVFSEEFTTFEKTRLSNEEVVEKACSFAISGDLFAIFLMTMHEYSLDDLLSVVADVRQAIPPQTQIVMNMGDFNLKQGKLLREAGVSGAYHVCRLREGVDTALDPERRKRTFKVIRDAGLDFYYCCEPIGPEHTSEELVEQMFLGVDYGCFQHAAMRRVHVPSLPMSSRGQITELRLAQILAVIVLATLGCKETQNIAVHEPNLLGLVAGANVVYAETGANPRDTHLDTSQNRGLDMAAARRMLYEAGFEALQLGDRSSVPLNVPYLLEAEAKTDRQIEV